MLDQSLANFKAKATSNDDVEPRSDAEVQAVIHQAVTHVQSIGHELVTGAHVLVEMLDRWPGSFLEEQGMTRYDAVTFLTRGSAEHPAPRMEQTGP